MNNSNEGGLKIGIFIYLASNLKVEVSVWFNNAAVTKNTWISMAYSHKGFFFFLAHTKHSIQIDRVSYSGDLRIQADVESISTWQGKDLKRFYPKVTHIVLDKTSCMSIPDFWGDGGREMQCYLVPKRQEHGLFVKQVNEYHG